MKAGRRPPSFLLVNPTALARLFVIAVAAVSMTARASPVLPRLLLLDGTAAGSDIVVVGERGTILRSSDQGHSWLGAPVATSATLTGVSFAAGTPHGWVVGHDALILATDDGGLTWHRQWQGENLQDSFLDVLAIDARNVFAVGAYGLFLTTTDGGKTWTRRKIIDEDFHLNRITCGPTGTLYLAGERGTLLRSADHGVTWARIDSPYDGSFYGILPLDSHTLVAHGLRGRIYRSVDDGEKWEPVANDQRVLIATALQLKGGPIVFAGQSRALLVSRDHAKTITAWPAPLATAVSKLIELPDGSVLALGEAGAVILPRP